jgi:hypothetical protein
MNQKGNKQASRSFSGWVYPSAVTLGASPLAKIQKPHMLDAPACDYLMIPPA